MPHEILEILASAVGVACYAIVLNTRGKKLLFTTIGGAASWSLFLAFKLFVANDAIAYFAVSVLMSVYSEILARRLKTPTTTFIIPSLIPLVPGRSLYYTIASAFDGQSDVFMDRLFDTLKLAAALALGIIFVSAVTRTILKVKTENNNQSK